jgi:hypothetical protein
MKLKSFGCSFIFGTDLADDSQDRAHLTASNLTWPAHLARHCGYQYECYARPGAGNLQIAERVLSHASQASDSVLFVIGWTWIDRFDYANLTVHNDGLAAQWHNWQTIMPVDKDNLALMYYKKLHSEYRDKLTTLMSIKLVIDTLKQKTCPFIMTYQDSLMFDDRWNTTPAVTELQNYVKPYMTTFEGKSFLDWSRFKGYPESGAWHPLEAAHEAAADYIIKVFDKKNTNVLTRPALS